MANFGPKIFKNVKKIFFPKLTKNHFFSLFWPFLGFLSKKKFLKIFRKKIFFSLVKKWFLDKKKFFFSDYVWTITSSIFNEIWWNFKHFDPGNVLIILYFRLFFIGPLLGGQNGQFWYQNFQKCQKIFFSKIN